MRGNYGRGRARATSEGVVLAEGELSFAVIPKPADWAASLPEA